MNKNENDTPENENVHLEIGENLGCVLMLLVVCAVIIAAILKGCGG